MTLPPIRRVVTGHDAGGRAIVVSDGALPTVVELAAIPGTIRADWACIRSSMTC